MSKEAAAFEEFQREYYQLSVRAAPAQSRALTVAHCAALAAQPEDIAAQTAKMERRANAGDKAKQARIRDMKVCRHS